MGKIKTVLAGKKVYILAGIYAVYSLVQWSQGLLDTSGLLEALWTSGLIGAGRAAVSKIEVTK